MRMFYQENCNPQLLNGKMVAVIGYGSQGHAHALNLRDSGVDVVVGLYEGSKSWQLAEQAGLKVMVTADAVKGADLVMILVNDEKQAQLYKESIEKNLKPGSTLIFAHGFNIHFGQIAPSKDINVIMVAPKGPGHTVRSQYEEGNGVPCLVAVYQDATGNAKDLALAYASCIGAGKAGILETTFKEETETDLFGEQTILCGGVCELMKKGFEVLVEAGYAPECAYFECLHEMKLVVDLIYSGGLTFMRYSVSDTAEFGDYSVGKRIITEETKDEMRKVLREIQEGTFAKSWLLENQLKRPTFNARRKMEQEHQLEQVGKELRKMMSWIK